MANDDHEDTLSIVQVYAESRESRFVVDNPKEYKLFEHFPDELIDAFETEDVAMHAHTWTITTDTYNQREPLRDFFEILAIDEHNN